jgi:hypothetical protein
VNAPKISGSIFTPERLQNQKLVKVSSQGDSSTFSHLAIKSSFVMAVNPAGHVRQQDKGIFFALTEFEISIKNV